MIIPKFGCQAVDIWQGMGKNGGQYEGTQATVQDSQVSQPTHEYHELAG
jgi:hypothetical protein